MAHLAVLRELLGFVWQNKAWWMLPPVIALALVALLVALSHSSVLGPIVYPLF
jgi:ABC-type dipeptide/oligopeptide/nickel transport system permease subunit